MAEPAAAPAPAFPAWRAFLPLWLGQSVSILGSRLTGFALSVWVFERTGSVTVFGAAVVLLTLPGVLASPVAGALVDRWSRRRAMVVSNAGAALTTLAAALLLLGGRLEVWHLCLILAANSIFDSLQQPAYLAAVTLLVPKESFGRISGLMQLSLAGARILAPALAGVLIAAIGLPAILLVDFATFVVALATVARLRLPELPASIRPAGKAPFRQQVREGWSYIRERPALLQLVGLFAGGSFLMSMLEVLMLPLILTLVSVAAAGAVSSAVGLGMLCGSLAMSAWGGPRRRVQGILVFSLVQGVALMLAGWRADLILVTAAFFLFAVSMPVVNGCNQVLWQSKTPPQLQGRVFAFRRLSAQLVAPLGMLIAGPLADRVFEPLLAPGGALAGSVGRWTGTGDGRGIGLLLIVLGGATLAMVLAAALSPRLQRIEDDVPDLPDAAAA